MTYTKLALHTVLASCASVLFAAVPAALAGTATVRTSEGDAMVFEYSGEEQMRMGISDDNYMLVRDNTLFVVGYQDGQPMVFDASSMMKGFAGMLDQAAPGATTNEFVSLEKTGRSETVAGIEGDVYLLTVIEDGEQRTDELVMSKDSRAVEFRDALFTMARAAVSALGDTDAAERSEEMEAQLRDTGLGVLRVGDEMTVTEISGDAIAAARFDLPAEPMDLNGLGAMMGGMGQAAPGDDEDAGEAQGGGGLFSGMMNAIGKQADRQADRSADKVDDKVDEESDKAVDNVLDKAFGRLFGRRN